jgi:hypothetical protein
VRAVQVAGRSHPARRLAMAPRRIPIDAKLVEGMASVGATDKEIANFLGCSVDTLTRRCADILTKSRADLRVRLRKAQITLALEGNATMLIWLGKQVLDQSDERSRENAGDPNETARQVRDAIRAMRDADGLKAA